MSSLLRPVGHLPASVYWFRRGLVLAVLLLLFILISRLFSGGGDDPQNTAASDPQQNPSSAPAAQTTPTSTPTSTATGKKTDKPTKTTPPADQKCAGSDVRIEVLPANRKIVSGSVLNFVVRLDAVSDECKATVDSTALTVTVMSGNDLIWTTTHCGQAIPRATLVVAKGKQAASTVGWNGRRSGPGCLPGQPAAKPGTYTVKAEFDDRVSAAQAFQVV
jgi:cytoskeletal protein RodZ